MDRAAMPAAIEFREVTYALRDGRTILHGISLAVEDGSVTALLGRSGSGKTTLLRTVNRMIVPTGGQVLVGGSDAQDGDAIALRRAIGYVIQETGLFAHFTVERNVGMVL